MKSRIAILLMAMISVGCIAPVDLDYPGKGGTLVVDGWITNQPGPYTIKLSRSIPYEDNQPLKVYSIPEANANVSIVDNFGNVEVLTKTIADGTVVPGSYQTNTLTGIVGRSYQLKIETALGEKYTSDSEKLIPVALIASFQAKFQITEFLRINANGNPTVQKRQDFALVVGINDPSEGRDYYRWKADGIFEFFSISLDKPTHCWASKPGRIENTLELADDLYFNGQPYSQTIGVVVYDRPTYFLVHLKQQSLTARAHDFLKQINAQQTSAGTLFDPPPTSITGNIRNESDPGEIVLGYFGASEEKRINLLINRFKESGYSNPVLYSGPADGDCRLMESQATNIKPEGFLE